VLLTQHSQNHHWSFPKGLLDHPEQTTEESALREVREEGGVLAEIAGKVGYSKYVYTFNNVKIFKVVTYFLMKYVSGDIKDHDWEVSDIGWYEQKAVAVLLALLHLGVKGIRLGPTLPAFVSPAVLDVLVKNFDIKLITEPKADVAAIMQGK